ncbi:hypothetical protein GH714_017156 [Hevea brasiliensis]|uniref:Leucine-rich repeat domain, L domain-containing protein n=1 Tax=Hevea brasiliensis TaxID=3981 RepID=A0A6A6LAM9_HEVBR|nr:hypothetical protein GH714_017156 [Hevea brasiliensis]
MDSGRGKENERDDDQNLASLEEISLSNSEHLTTFPDLSQAKNLERVNLDYCTSLVEVPSSIRFLDKLTFLSMRCCTSVVSLPSGIKLRSLKTLNLSGCTNLRECPEISENITYLNLNGTAIGHLPKSIGHLSGLVALNMKDCKQLWDLPESLHLLKFLRTTNFSGCSSITKFPDISTNIQFLYLSETGIEELPSTIGELSKLSCLDLKNCKRLKNIPCTISKLASLEKLIVSGCSSINKFPEVSKSIKKLFLCGTAIEEIPSSIEYCSELVELSMQNCKKFRILPSCILFQSGFSHQSLGLSMTIQLPSHWDNSEFLGFALCAVIAFNNQSTNDLGFQVKCRYHFRNDHGDCNDLYCYFGGCCYGRNYWEGEDCGTAHTFFGYDPFVDVTRDDWFGKYSKLLVEFYPEDMNGYRLVCSNVISCGVRMLYAQEERFCQCSFINRHVEAWSKTEGPMWYDEENMGPFSWLKSSVLKLKVFRHRHFGCLDVIDQKELDLLISEISTDKSQKHYDMEELISACQFNEFI